jgi:selenide,water dikinase
MSIHPDLLVGVSTGDDAAVYRLTDGLAIINTLDFFPPIVDDPYDFGVIAVANALSDVYAMGGKPLLGLNIVCFPEDVPKDVLVQILKGGADKAQEAGVVIGGGHTIIDKEPKYGMAVTGVIAPDSIMTNANAKQGDALVLTKPLGTGIITTAAKAQRADAAVIRGAVESMATLNRDASESMLQVGANSCTDITGFGLIGHLNAMMFASATTAHLQLSAIPLLPGARELAEQGNVPGGTARNLDSVSQETKWHPDITGEDHLLLCDAQTSGGLLISLPQARVGQLVQALEAKGVLAAVIGSVGPKGEMPVEVVP